jgi:hypothetical protein
MSLPNQPTTERRERDSASDVSIPLESMGTTELVFTRGISLASIQADPALPERFRGHFEGPPPQVEVSGQQLIIHYRRLALVDWARYALLWGRDASVMRLSTAAPWRIIVRGGASRLTADLRALALLELVVQGGASDVRIELPPPSGVVPLRIIGGVSNITLRRPPGSAARLVIQGGAQQLAFDAQHFGAIGGGVRLESAGPRDAPDRYEIEVTGGASNLVVDTW